MAPRSSSSPVPSRIPAPLAPSPTTRGRSSIRCQVACGIYRPIFADFGVVEALRAQAVRASVLVSLAGAAPRSIQPAEIALYFSCLEAIQNVATHAGRAAHAGLGCTTNTAYSPCASRTKAVALTPRHPRRCGPEEYSRAHPSARRHRHAHLAPGLGTVLMISLPRPLTTAENLRQPQSPSGIPTQTMGT